MGGVAVGWEWLLFFVAEVGVGAAGVAVSLPMFAPEVFPVWQTWREPGRLAAVLGKCSAVSLCSLLPAYCLGLGIHGLALGVVAGWLSLARLFRMSLAKAAAVYLGSLPVYFVGMQALADAAT